MSTLERYARVRAAIERSGDRDRVLEAEGITRAAWTAMQQRWLDALSAEVEGGGTTLAERYFLAFTGARGDAPASDAIEEIAPSPEPIAAPVVISPAAPVAPAMPSQPEPPAPRAVPAFAQGTALSFEVPRGPAMPFRTGGPVSPLAASGAPPPHAWAQGLVAHRRCSARAGDAVREGGDASRPAASIAGRGCARSAGPPITPPAAAPRRSRRPSPAAPPAIPELNVE
ncbi:MAG: hypothetical protein U0359_10715 [Byssovorax sp.]